ncbi:MAG: murein biosynthesis integral membrane protein MurJ [Planctomycetota bacterium]|nr:MAG: murein biosynthesis integral membrane protein MurJ [Planctomycetota bacterium]
MKHIWNSAKLISLLTLGSRLLGLARDILCAAIFGLSWMWDAFLLAWTLPNLFRRLFGEGAITSALLPLFQKKHQEHPKKGQQLVNLALSYMLSLLAKILFLLYLVVFAILLCGQLKEKYFYTILLLLILLPYLPLICLSAASGAILNALDHFLIPAFLPLFLNLFWIGGILSALWLVPEKSAQLLTIAFFLLAGGAGQLALSMWGLKKMNISWRWKNYTNSPEIEELRKKMFPVLLSGSVLQLNTMLDRVIAEAFVPGNGGVSALYFGNRMVQFPLAMIGIAIATAVFPSLSKSAQQKSPKQFQSLLTSALKMTSFIALPAAIGLFVLASPIIQALFERGAFLSHSTTRTAKVLAYYAPSVYFFCLIHVFSKAYYAQGDVRTPVKISLAMVGLNLCLNLILVLLLQESGLALSTSLTSCLHFLLLYLYSPHSISLWGPLLRQATIAALMGGILLALKQNLPIPIIWAVLTYVLAGVGVYFSLARIFLPKEWKELLSSFQK